MSTLRTVTDADFAAEVLAAGRPVLVEFTATWCVPCRQLAPVLERVAEEHADELDVVAVAVDTSPEAVARYAVLSTPTTFLFRDGEPVRSVVGALSKRRLLRALDLTPRD
ncbi:thioredoxin family protein [Streptomyces sp. enrichment culture]|uniref:thioredoxin family protein n=1 Tax=Streptomyces sp. enrichment culture TaxID=1795815 RepID=UPI003F573B3B